MIFQIISYSIQILALAVGFKYKSRFKDPAVLYFLYYLVFVVLNQLAELLNRYLLELPRFIFYNIYDIVTFLFFLYWFNRVLKKKTFLYIVGSLYLIALGVSLYFENIVYNTMDINTIAGTIMTLILVMYFYAGLLRKNEVVTFTADPRFWISTGLMIFYIGFLPILIVLNIDGFNATHIDVVILALNVLMYGCFIRAFLCYRTMKN